MRVLLKILLLSIIGTLPFWLKGQNIDFVFNHFTEKDGLSYNVVNSFMKDSKGLMWIGTFNGFNRFDGSNFYNFKIRKGSNSINSEAVHELCEDNRGNIWGCTTNGAFCYYIKQDSFHNYYFDDLDFFNILKDQSGNIWISSNKKLYRFNPLKDDFEAIVEYKEQLDNPEYVLVAKNGMLEDTINNGIWITSNLGLLFYDIKGKKLKTFKSNPNHWLFAKRYTSALSKGSGDLFWFIDHNSLELISFSAKTLQLNRQISLKRDIDYSSVATTFEDRQQRLWFCTWNYKAAVMDLRTEVITPLTHSDDERTIASPFFWAVFQDDDNTIWFGTIGGISRCNPEAGFYKEHRLNQHIPELNNDYIWRMEEDPVDKCLWIITSKKYLIQYKGPQEFNIYHLDNAKPNKEGLLPDWVNHIYFHDNKVIISCYTGSWQLEKGSKRIVPFNDLPLGYMDFRCNEIIFEPWESYYNNGKEVLHWDRKNNKTQMYQFEEKDISKNEVPMIRQIFIDRNKKLWGYSGKDYLAYVNQQNKFSRIYIKPDGNKASGNLVDVDIDHQGKFWLVYKGIGMFLFDPISKNITSWNETDGLPGNRLQQIKVDKNMKVWTMMYNKISVFSPESKSFYNFKIPYKEGELNYYNHLTKRSNGNLLGSINNEIVEFFPDKLLANQMLKKPIISQVIASGKIFQNTNELIELAPEQNTLRFFFGCFTDVNSIPYDLEYMLLGAENNWTKVGANHEAMYNNLSSGQYTFKVRAIGKNKASLSEEAILSFIISTPLYKTWWFLSILLITLAFFLYGFYRNRLKQQRQVMTLESKAQNLEKEKAQMMYDGLKQQLNPHFLFNSLTSLSALIAADQELAGKFLSQMSDMYRYILKNANEETVLLKDEINFALSYYNLQKTRFGNGLIVNIDIPPDQQFYKIAPVTLQNMIENAIKHNVIDVDSPLVIDIFIENEYLVIKNNLQPKVNVETSNKKGILQFKSLYQYLSPNPVLIEQTNSFYSIKIPLF